MDIHTSHADWFLSVNLDGGRIKELSYKQIKVFGTYNRIDGKEGSTHICAPSFDKEGQDAYNLPFHGYARTLKWAIEKQTADSVEISTITPLSSTYPASLKIVQVFSIKNNFIHTVQISHREGKSVPVNIGLHYYWDTPIGWENTTVNRQDITVKIKTNEYSILHETNKIIFPHTTYILRTNSFHTAVLWSSFKTDEEGKKQYNDDFCCIEPVIKWPNFFGSDPSILMPGKTVSASVSLEKVV